MIKFDPNVVAEIAKDAIGVCWYVEFLFPDSPCRYIDNDIRIYKDGDLFLPRGLKISDIKLSSALSVDSVSVTVDDAQGDFIGTILLQERRGTEVLIYLGIKLGIGNIVGCEIFRGMYAKHKFPQGEGSVEITVKNDLVLWRQKTQRLQTADCPWTYGGDECGHTGSWCDQSPQRCAALGNYIHFGGDKFIPVIMEKPVWWGRIPK